ncbi:ComEA family DNA-binding protein [Psychrobacter celer]|uniref:ComEA family DNA-binding protein n=1 Tax=Psychrobacter TaxID=497 RepID=UPI003F982ED9
MNVHHKPSLIGAMLSTAVSAVGAAAAGAVLIMTLMLSEALAATCFTSPQQAYASLLAQEAAQLQASTQTVVNINRAGEGELVSLHGIGSSKAQAIILYREMFGGFQTVDDLAKVKGIGQKTVEKNRARISVQDE